MANKKMSIRTVKNKCNRLWSEIIKLSYGGRCVLCGSQQHLNAHHLISRQVLATRYHPLCGVLLCAGCHSFRLASAHKSPWILYDWLRTNRPAQYQWFVANQPLIFEPNPKWGLAEYIDMMETLQEYLKKLKEM